MSPLDPAKVTFSVRVLMTWHPGRARQTVAVVVCAVSDDVAKLAHDPRQPTQWPGRAVGHALVGTASRLGDAGRRRTVGPCYRVSAAKAAPVAAPYTTCALRSLLRVLASYCQIGLYSLASGMST